MGGDVKNDNIPYSLDRWRRPNPVIIGVTDESGNHCWTFWRMLLKAERKAEATRHSKASIFACFAHPSRIVPHTLFPLHDIYSLYSNPL